MVTAFFMMNDSAAVHANSKVINNTRTKMKQFAVAWTNYTARDIPTSLKSGDKIVKPDTIVVSDEIF